MKNGFWFLRKGRAGKPTWRWALFATALLLVVVSVLGWWRAAQPVEILVSYGVSLSNRGEAAARDVRVLLLAPQESTSHQLLVSLDSSHPYRMVHDAMGNRLLEFKFAELEPEAARTVTLLSRLQISSGPRWQTPLPSRADLLPEKFIESDAGEIRTQAEKVLRGRSRGLASSMAGVVARMVVLDPSLSDGGALAAMRRGAGTTFDRACLVAALFRAQEIPARVAGGFALAAGVSGPVTVTAHDLRYWAEAYLEGEWWDADPAETSGLLRVTLRHYLAQGEQDLPPVSLGEFAWMPDEFRASDE